MNLEKAVSFVKKHPEWFTVFGLGILFYFIFFHNIGGYPLMDVDETRYVAMSRDMFNLGDYLTLYLNGDYFFEKPPLFFWIEWWSFGLFNKINEFTARFPVALCGTLCAYLAYFTGKKAVSRNYGVISALILATSLEFVILSKFAILDIVVSTCVLFSVYSGLMTYFCEDSSKKYFWWLFYLFSGLAVMAKGIPGFVIPFGAMFFITISTGKFKEIFKPVYIFPGILLFLLVTLPWHIIMFHLYNPLFYDEYIIKHHIQRFVSSEGLGRHEPWFFFILVFLWGFLPWTYSMIAAGIARLSYLKTGMLRSFSYEKLDTEHKFLFMNGVIFLFILIFFSVSSAKLITYILPVYMPAAFLLAHVWKNYIEKSEYKTSVNTAVYVWGGICITAAFIAVFTTYFLPYEINGIIAGVKWFSIVLLLVFGVLSVISAAYNKKVLAFASYVLLVAVLSAFGTEGLFKLDYKFGQDDLMEFAAYAKKHNKKIMTFGFDRKYSLLYYAGEQILYDTDFDYKLLEETLNNPEYVIVLKNKQLADTFKKVDCEDFEVILEGVKYILVQKEY